MKTQDIPPPVIKPGERYIIGDRMRWVLAVGNDHVIYSRGGDAHMECQIKTFLRWIREGIDDEDEELSA